MPQGYDALKVVGTLGAQLNECGYAHFFGAASDEF
jgi:hypothetical protein